MDKSNKLGLIRKLSIYILRHMLDILNTSHSIFYQNGIRSPCDKCLEMF